MNDIRLIAMDMDGTLLNSQQTISPENARALQEARKQGIRLAICSGRSPGDIALFALENHMEDCALLSMNGTYCLHNAHEEEPFSEHLLEPDTLAKTIAVIREHRMPFACFAQNQVVIVDNDAYGYDFWVSHSGGELAPKLLYNDEGLHAVWERGVNKIIVIGETQEAIEQARTALEAVPGLDVTSSWARNLELMPGGFNKGSAVRELAEALGLSAEQVMTFGDYDNDESMIAYAGLGVAMANATDCVKRASKLVTRSNDEDGVAWAIRKYALKNE